MLGRRLDEDDGTHEFHALNTLLLVVVLGLCLLSAYLIKKYRFYFMPESSAALCVGLVVGGIARLITHSDEELDFLSFSPELFFFLLLPPIIFEAGYTLRRKNFFRNLGTITMYAVVGTLISTFVVGYFTYACARAGIVDVDATNPMEALLFGALISAVDPVATLSIMGSPELNCDPLLYSLVFGESVLNDAVAIVLFRTFYNYYEEGAELDQSKIPVALFEFLFVTIGSILMGVATGLICSYLFRHTRIRDYPKYEISLLFLFAYGAYALAESIELSGIMALFFCGIVLAHYNSYNLSKTSQTTAEEIFAALSTVAESFVFMYMGMGTSRVDIKLRAPFNFWCVVVCVRYFSLNTVACIARGSCPSLSRNQGRGAEIARRNRPHSARSGERVASMAWRARRRSQTPSTRRQPDSLVDFHTGFFTGRFKTWDHTFVVLAIVFCLLGRILNVFPLSFMCNLVRKQKIPWKMQVVIWFAGLRGAIAFALSQNMPGPHKDVYETTTLSIVIFTTVVCGGLTEPMLRHAGMKRGTDAVSDGDDDLHTELLEVGEEPPQRRLSIPAPGLHAAFRELDQRYLKPLFGGQMMPGPDTSVPHRAPLRRPGAGVNGD